MLMSADFTYWGIHQIIHGDLLFGNIFQYAFQTLINRVDTDLEGRFSYTSLLCFSESQRHCPYVLPWLFLLPCLSLSGIRMLPKKVFKFTTKVHFCHSSPYKYNKHPPVFFWHTSLSMTVLTGSSFLPPCYTSGQTSRQQAEVTPYTFGTPLMCKH